MVLNANYITTKIVNYKSDMGAITPEEAAIGALN